MIGYLSVEIRVGSIVFRFAQFRLELYHVEGHRIDPI